MKFTFLDESENGIPGIEYSNEEETQTTGSDGVIEFKNGREFIRNEAVSPPTAVAKVVIDCLPNTVKI